MSLLIYCTASRGGIAEHTHYQAKALAELREDAGKVEVLCAPDFLAGRPSNYRRAEVFAPSRPEVRVNQGKFARLFSLIAKSRRLIADQWRLAWEVWRRKPEAVLLASYSEYLAPLWVWPHWLLAKCAGVVYVANLHDPERDYVVGPRWWHDLSVRMAYWPISIGVVHEKLPEPSPVPGHVRVVEAPVGVYDLQESPEDPASVRAAWSVPADAVVFLAFGFIRDNKNLDLVIRALASCPESYLVIMGKAQSQKDRPVEFYRKLAEEQGVDARVRFYDAFVPDEKLASYFAAADVVVLTYDKTFHSQSGVLNIAARARRPVLASAGESPLKTSVEKFRLGVFVAPDNLEALKEGIRKVTSDEWRVKSEAAERQQGAGLPARSAYRSERSVERGAAEGCGISVNQWAGGSVGRSGGVSAAEGPDWEGYEAFASWRTNAEVIVAAIRDVSAKRAA